MYNSLQIVNFIVLAINLASVSAGTLLCGYQYGMCLKRRYLEPIEVEQQLIN